MGIEVTVRRRMIMCRTRLMNMLRSQSRGERQKRDGEQQAGQPARKASHIRHY
jgi:hypothetical protein